MPPKPSRSRSVSSQIADVEAGLRGDLLGLGSQPGGVLEVARHRRQHPRAPARATDRDRPVERGLVGAVEGPGRSRDHDLAHRTLLRAGRAPVELERAEHGAGDEGVERGVPSVTGSPSGATAGIDVATASCRARRGRVPHRRGGRRPDGAWPTPTSSTSRSAGLAAVPSGTGTSTTSPTAPVILRSSATPSRSTSIASIRSAAPGPSRMSGLAVGGAGQDRQRPPCRHRRWRPGGARSVRTRGVKPG